MRLIRLGDIVDIEVRQSKISVIRSESFSKLTCLKRLQIDDNIIDRIEPMGFYQPWLDYRQISHLVPATKRLETHSIVFHLGSLRVFILILRIILGSLASSRRFDCRFWETLRTLVF